MSDDQSGLAWADLTAFQRDVVVSILRQGGRPDGPDAPHGLAIKDDLDGVYGTDVNHGRLYPNLDTLVDRGFVDKGERDRRTNAYHVTEDAVDALHEWLDDFVGTHTPRTKLIHDAETANIKSVEP